MAAFLGVLRSAAQPGNGPGNGLSHTGATLEPVENRVRGSDIDRMTLIAAARLQGIPVLFGDLLLTAPAKVGMDSFHPVQPDAAARLPKNSGMRIAGAARKAILINDHLALGWTGSAFAAGSVLKSFKQSFGNKQPTFDGIKSFLRGQDAYKKESLSFHLIGWVFEREHRCFLWNSQWPDELFEADEHFDGTGEKLFKSLLTGLTARTVGSGFRDPTELVPYVAATKMGRCIAEDIVSGKLTTNYFGYGFEAIYWDGVRYRYVDEVTYVIKWQIAKLAQGDKLRTISPELCIKYKSYNRYCVLQTIHLAGHLKDNTYIDMIVMPGDKPNDRDFHKEIPFSYSSPIVCSYVEVTVPGGQKASAPMVTTRGDEELIWISENGSRLNLLLKPKEVYWALASQIPGFLLRPPMYQ
jgi:hypothetical protein